MTTSVNSALPPSIGMTGMRGAEAPRGNLGMRVFRACKGTVTRAARSLSRAIACLGPARARHAPIAAKSGGPRRAGIGRLDFSLPPGPGDSGMPPGAASRRSTPDGVARATPDLPSPTGSIPGVRLKPGRSAGGSPAASPAADGPPALPPRSPALERLWSGTPVPARGDEAPRPPGNGEPPR